MDKSNLVRGQFSCDVINQFVIFNPWKVPWNWFSGWGTDRNIIKISCHSRLFFVLHLLVNIVIIMAITRKAVEHVFILIQFFSYLRKQGWLFTIGAFEWIHPWARLNELFDFCNRQKIIMVLGEGRSLTGLLELVWYLTPNVAMASQTIFVCLFCCYLLVKNFFNHT